MRSNRSPLGVIGLVMALVAIGALAVGCGDDDDSASSTTTAPKSESSTTAAGSDVCAERDALKSSVEGLKNVDLTKSGTNGVEAAVGEVKDDLEALGDSVSDELKPEVTAVQDAVDELETAVADLDSGGASKALEAVSSVTSSASTLIASLEDAPCS